MKRFLCAFLAVTVVFLLILSGCGGSSNQQNSGDQQSAAVPASSDSSAVEPAKAEKATIRYWYSANEADPNDFLAVWNKENIQMFQEQNPNVTIEPTVLQGDAYYTKITTENAAGNLPDVFTAWVGGRLKPFVDAGAIAPIDEMIDGNAELKNIVNPANMTAVTFDGKTYAIPLSLDSEMFAYNKEIFAKYDVSIPETYADLMDAIKVFNDNGVIPIAMGNKDPWVGIIPVQGFGDRVIGQDKVDQVVIDHTGSFTDPEIASIFELLVDMKNANAFSPNFEGLTYEDSKNQFTNGNAAMWFVGTWDLVNLDAAMGDNVDFFNFPIIKEGVGSKNAWIINQNGAYCVSSKSQFPDAAKEFVQFVFSVERQTVLGNTGMLLCAKNLPIDESKLAPMLVKFNKCMAEAEYPMVCWEIPLGNNVGGELRTATEMILDGADIKDTLEKLEKAHAAEFK